MSSSQALPEEPVQDGPDDAAEVEAGPTHVVEATDLLDPRDDAHVAELLMCVVHQDEAALAELYQLLSHRVRRVAQRLVGQPYLADEVVEDTFWQVWRQAPRFDPLRGSGMAWVMTIARSRALDAWRRQQRQHAREHHGTEDLDALHSAAEGDTDTHADLADWLIRQRELERLHQALAMLDASPRQLVTLTFLRGLTHEEVAQSTGLPLGSVKSQIRRAMQSLRRWLGTEYRGLAADDTPAT